MSAKDNYQHQRVLYAYHEVGHAVVWHAVGDLIEEISIASDQRGYRGHCRFGPLIKETEDHGDWATQLASSRRNPEMVTAYYAGMLSLAFYCASYEGENDYLEGSERDDLEKIASLLLQLGSDEQQREMIKNACWHEAQKILSEYWSAVQALVTKLAKRWTLEGSEVHRTIWQTIGYPDSDWRLQVLNIKRKSIQ